MVRQATPSAWPSSSRLGFCSTMQVLMSANADKLRRQRQPGRPAADDQDVDFGRNRPGSARRQDPLGGIGDFGLARLEAVQVELHVLLASAAQKSRAD